MDNFNISGTRHTPHVILDSNKGLVEIGGRSIPEQTTEFYETILNWIDGYLEDPAEETIINYQLEYYNSASKKYLIDILRKFTPMYKEGKNVKLNWYYEEDDDEEEDAGILLGELSELPVKMIKVPEE